MSEQVIPYREWPKQIKVLTALSMKSILVKNPKAIRGLSFVNIGIGVSFLFLLTILASVFGTLPEHRANPIDTTLAFLAFVNIVIGLFNYFFTCKTIDWINQNSTWEERFANTSSVEDKLLYVGVLVGLLLISFALAYIY